MVVALNGSVIILANPGSRGIPLFVDHFFFGGYICLGPPFNHGFTMGKYSNHYGKKGSPTIYLHDPLWTSGLQAANINGYTRKLRRLHSSWFDINPICTLTGNPLSMTPSHLFATSPQNHSLVRCVCWPMAISIGATAPLVTGFATGATMPPVIYYVMSQEWWMENL